jgi:ribosomal protein S18 acetylase RimI-like enzyme
MRFELTGALVDSILFSMEDQNGELLLDTRKGIVAAIENRESGGEADRYLALPRWGPSEGFRLMERFASGLHNPLIREELSAALDQGKGVFRAFKDAIARYPETEKLWFRFKTRAMKREIIRWYNALRETWGLELIGAEPEDTEGLVLEDFRFRAGIAADRQAAAELHRVCGEMYRREALNREPAAGSTSPALHAQNIIAELFTAMNPWAFPGDLCLVAETSGGELAAYISAVDAGPARLHIHALEVGPEYQGLGLGESLLGRLLEQTANRNIRHISIDLPNGAEHFARVLLRESFQPCVQRYCRYQA